MKYSLVKLKLYLLKKSAKMFNLYQHMKTNSEGEKTQKEPEYTGHDRFYQERPRTSYRKKKRRGACRRAQSAAELNPESIAAANKRNAFRIRSVSTDREESEEENSERTPLVAQKIDSLAKLLFNKSLMGIGSGKSSPSEPPASPRVERSMESSAALAICTEYLSQTSRYDLISQLGAIGSRPNKHWFAIHDNSIKTDRLLTLMPLTNKCPVEPTERSRGLIMELFRALHHPYICPVLDLELCNGHALAVLPFNCRGSLKDLIYKSTWNDEYSRKYGSTGTGLPAWQVARFGRQMLEGLMFLKEKGFPPFRHLQSGNVVVQNGVARMAATCVVQPLDLIKTRMQLSGGGRSSFAVAGEIVAREGFFNLYTGLSAGLLRQATYTTTRLGVYNYLFDAYKERNAGAAPGFGTKTLLGVAAGSIGAFVGTPAEVALIRMTADGRLPAEQRRNYKNVADALIRIVKEEGVLKLWRGATPTVARAMVVNSAQLSTYSQAREIFVAYVPDGILLHFCASMVSGLITTIASMPVDIIKTRIQNAAKGESQLGVVTNLLRNEGVLSLWKGFLPYYARLGPHTVLTFIFLEQLNSAYFKYT